jgi:hypothetical protein
MRAGTLAESLWEESSMTTQFSSKELISELRALDLPGVAPIARAAAAEIERLQATNVPKNGDVYLALVRSGYSQHEAHEIASMVESMQCQRHDCEVMRDELQELRAVHEPKAECSRCRGSGEVKAMTQEHGPDDYEFDAECPDCKGVGVVDRATVPPSALQQELAVTNKLLDERNRLLDAIPECPQHGRQCVPHAIEWVQKRATVPPCASCESVSQIAADTGLENLRVMDERDQYKQALYQANGRLMQLGLDPVKLEYSGSTKSVE